MASTHKIQTASIEAPVPAASPFSWAGFSAQNPKLCRQMKNHLMSKLPATMTSSYPTLNVRRCCHDLLGLHEADTTQAYMVSGNQQYLPPNIFQPYAYYQAYGGAHHQQAPEPSSIPPVPYPVRRSPLVVNGSSGPPRVKALDSGGNGSTNATALDTGDNKRTVSDAAGTSTTVLSVSAAKDSSGTKESAISSTTSLGSCGHPEGAPRAAAYGQAVPYSPAGPYQPESEIGFQPNMVSGHVRCQL